MAALLDAHRRARQLLREENRVAGLLADIIFACRLKGIPLAFESEGARLERDTRDMNVEKHIAYWRTGAEEDWAVGEELLERRPRHALFMFHLALEKALERTCAGRPRRSLRRPIVWFVLQSYRD